LNENGYDDTNIDEVPSIDLLIINYYDEVMLDKQSNPAWIFHLGIHTNIDAISFTQQNTQTSKEMKILSGSLILSFLSNEYKLRF
jgi:hypothetical protein